MSIRILFWLGAALSVACASARRPEDAVRIVRDPELVRGCRPVGPVEAISSTSGVKDRSYSESYETRRDSANQHAYLRDRATKLGADVVLLNDERPDRVVGQAYRCGETR